MIKAIIFDLDDTLYEELSFVKGGFNEVAEEISKESKIGKEEIFNFLVNILSSHGRGKVFDICLEKLNLSKKIKISNLVKTYREHTPKLDLYFGAKETLQQLKSKYLIGLISDGDVGVQKKKVDSLKIKDLFNYIIFTWEFGEQKQKPDTFSYKKMIEKLNLMPEQIVYVGDDPHKDFIGAKKLNIKTIRVLTGRFAKLKLSKEYEADFEIRELKEIFNILENLNNSKQKDSN